MAGLRAGLGLAHVEDGRAGLLWRDGPGARLCRVREGAGFGALRQGLVGGEDEDDAAQGSFGGHKGVGRQLAEEGVAGLGGAEALEDAIDIMGETQDELARLFEQDVDGVIRGLRGGVFHAENIAWGRRGWIRRGWF